MVNRWRSLAAFACWRYLLASVVVDTKDGQEWRLAIQLAIPAREWFFADIVRIGLADGPLSGDERQAAQEIAAQLGMTQAQARGVISMTEESAPA